MVFGIARPFVIVRRPSISNGTVSTTIYDKGDGFDFDIVNFHSSMAMYLGIPRMECTYLSLFVSLEHLLT